MVLKFGTCIMQPQTLRELVMAIVIPKLRRLIGTRMALLTLVRRLLLALLLLVLQASERCVGLTNEMFRRFVR